ncbi:hypothetical protein B7P43_G06730 [Cryptotermes secundus]|uniref:Ig-like domain-containing protein n=1 Tax=Cryptotermes secundus TaxID=105785 RepID=A0A2J7QZ80_9NEOP|nr:hypothetical protein B7P43_G06730 [Cryptotermes secundus]
MRNACRILVGKPEGRRPLGRPRPNWVDNIKMDLRKKGWDEDTFSGDTLTLLKLDRKQMGAYLCIASNDVPPAVSKRITLNVNFAPVVKVLNQLLGAPLGTNVSLECHVEAFPNTINYWVKNRGEMLLDGAKHSIVENRTSYKVHLKLTVNQLSRRDLGVYMCVSTNSLGHADGTVRLYEIKVATQIPVESTENQVATVSDPRARLQSFGWEIMEHATHSPDLAPSDYHMFGPLKKFRSGQRFISDDDAKTAVRRCFRPQPAEFYNSGISKLVVRWDKCLNRGSDYVEK